MIKNFKIGDIVEIIDDGSIYDFYDETTFEAFNGEILRVKKIIKHSDGFPLLILKSTRGTVVIGLDGVKKVCVKNE